MPGTLPTIFIIYSHTDKADSTFADRLEASLRASSFHIWGKLQNGRPSWLNEFQDALRQCQVCLVVLSSDALQNLFVVMTTRHARDEGKKVYFLENKRQMVTLPQDLQVIRHIPFHKDYAQGLQELLSALTGNPAANPPAANQPIQPPSTHSGAGGSGIVALVTVIVIGIIIYGFLSQQAAYLKGDPIDGINCDTLEQGPIHYHAHLQIYIKGIQTSIPGDVGRQSRTGCSYWLHAQPDAGDEGVIHVESPDNRTFTLHQFFDIWGQQLSATNLLGNQVDASNRLTVYVYTPTNQPTDSKRPFTVTPPSTLKPDTHDPSGIILKPHELIVLEYGTPIVLPPAWTFLAAE